MPREFVRVDWDENAKRIVCYLPLTKPTGRCRVKRNGQPVPARRVHLQPNDVLEWQIAYKDDTGKPAELGEMLQLAFKHGLLGVDDMRHLQSLVETQTRFCEEVFRVQDEPTPEEFVGFEVWWRKHPVLHREVDDAAIIEIEVRHRQKAVGFQAMVFLLVPLCYCEPPNLIGRTAERNEHALWSPPMEVLKVLVQAFAIASKRHKDDMVKLLREISLLRDP